MSYHLYDRLRKRIKQEKRVVTSSRNKHNFKVVREVEEEVEEEHVAEIADINKYKEEQNNE